jgi:hypothetical protein
MIKLYELNQETRDLLDVFTAHDVALIIDCATDLMMELEQRSNGSARMGENGCVELAYALLMWLKEFHERKGNCHERNDGDHNHGKAIDGLRGQDPKGNGFIH